MTMWGFRGRRALLRVRRSDWEALVAELGVRGRGEREAGAFLLADQAGDRRRVTRVVYLDDLDPDCLQGDIHLDGRAYSKLWDICDAERRVVVGDVHTHPGRCVHQSGIDAENPMVAQDGHVAVILPDYATRPIEPHEAGIHRYDGGQWTTWTGKAAAKHLSIRRLA
jgi:proteasome lid subunit RPN8/RPN11